MTEEDPADVYLRLRAQFPSVADARDAGASKEELLPVAALTISTRGFPAEVAAFAWIEEMLAAGS